MATHRSFPEWARNQVVYEVNLRQYTPEGTISAFRKHLPRLKQLGAGILWFMPVQPIGIKNRKGSLGSYYSIRNYHQINEEFGTLDEFIALVKEIHSMGMYVIIDWVANHTAWDHHWVDEHMEYYRHDSAGNVCPPFPEWEDVIALDYTNHHLRQAMIEEMKFWVRETGIDGFRCDMAMLVPTDFWERARLKLDNIRKVFMLAEAESRDLVANAFDVLYNWNLFHVFNDIASGKYNAGELRWRIPSEIEQFPQGADNLLFISNHDENSWNGSELERLGPALEPIAVLTFTLPGMPLIYSGQEAANTKRLSFFEKDCIEWKQDKMADLYTLLSRLKREMLLLSSFQPTGELRLLKTNADDKIFAFMRELENERLLVVLNLSPHHVEFQFSGSGYQGKYSNLLQPGMNLALFDNPCFSLAPWKYHLLLSE